MTELLSPAGDLEKLKIAFLYGADAVFLGGKEFSLRANATNFDRDELISAQKIASELNKKIYVTINIFFHDKDFEGLEDYLIFLDSIGIYGVIVSDIAVISLINKLKLNLFIVLSTQSSTLNYETVNFWKKLGVKRIVLARESSKEDIKTIIEKTGIEVEAFIHGAMCTSISGKCVMSNYCTNRDANRGGCAQVCRWTFASPYDEEFSMMSKDLNMVECLEDMIKMGVVSYKIEGRMRSSYYIAVVIKCYRALIDKIKNNTLTLKDKEYYLKILNNLSNRDSGEVFFNKMADYTNSYFDGRSEKSNQDFLGIVLDYDEYTNVVTLEVRNYFEKGNCVMFYTKDNEYSYVLNEIIDENNNVIDICRHPKMVVKFKTDFKLSKDDMMVKNIFDNE